MGNSYRHKQNKIYTCSNERNMFEVTPYIWVSK